MRRPPAGWTSDMVIFRSGQAALASILQFVAAAWGDKRTLSVAHAGAYFETTALLAAWPRRTFRPTPASVVSADVVIGEPVWCNGCFGATERLPRARHVLLLDTTMVGPSHDLCSCLAAAADDCEVAIAFSSGLKLDQAGLELANVGIARVLVRDGARPRATEIAGRLRQLRGLMATGLTLDELSALSAPWFLDRAYVDTYTTAIFANNRLLAQSIGGEFGRLRPALPSLAVGGRRRCPVLRPSTPRGIARALPASGRDRRAAERAARPAVDQGRVVRVPRPSLRADRARTPTRRSLPARRHGLARRP